MEDFRSHSNELLSSFSGLHMGVPVLSLLCPVVSISVQLVPLCSVSAHLISIECPLVPRWCPFSFWSCCAH